MPNWCENILVVEGKENDVKTFVKNQKENLPLPTSAL